MAKSQFVLPKEQGFTMSKEEKRLLEKFRALTYEIESNSDLSGLEVPGWVLTENLEDTIVVPAERIHRRLGPLGLDEEEQS